jgi:hypothetical protein
MIPAGYMYKYAGPPPSSLEADNVKDIFSAGHCGGGTAPPFADYIGFWKHNGYWLFNSPQIMEQIAAEETIDLSEMTLFYYEYYELQFDRNDDPGNPNHVEGWSIFECAPDFVTDVVYLSKKSLAGYDVTEHVRKGAPECSLLSCSNLAARFQVNEHCLFETFDLAKKALESGAFHEKEPGPYRIVAVYLVPKSYESRSATDSTDRDPRLV